MCEIYFRKTHTHTHFGAFTCINMHYSLILTHGLSGPSLLPHEASASSRASRTPGPTEQTLAGHAAAEHLAIHLGWATASLYREGGTFCDGRTPNDPTTQRPRGSITILNAPSKQCSMFFSEPGCFMTGWYFSERLKPPTR